jgi:hypothetical protein
MLGTERQRNLRWLHAERSLPAAPGRSTTRRRLALAVGLVAIVGAVGGWGGSDAPSASAAFIEEADAICQRALDRHPHPKSTGTQEGAVRAAGAAAARRSAEERGFKRLRAPKKLKRDFAAFKRDTHQMQQLAVTGKGAAQSGNQALYNQAMKDYRATHRHRRSIGKRIGFKVCGKRT